MHVVRTTFQPDKEIEVDDAEYADLKSQGLLVEDAAEENSGGQDGSEQDSKPKPKPATGNAGIEK
jgi:hypothetical protein